MPVPVVLVTRPEYVRGEPVFRSSLEFQVIPAPPEEDALSRAIVTHGASYVIVGPVPYTGALYEALPRGGVIARFGVGHESVDKTRATAAGLLCTNTPDVLQQSVAELAMLLIGAAARHLLPVAASVAGGGWTLQQGVELRGKTLAVVGCGAIGRALARIARAGYGMRVVGFHRSRRGAPVPDAGNFTLLTSDFAEAVGGADFVSLHVPGTPENARMINQERLAMFPSHAWLINTARGAVVDEVALYDALRRGQIAGAALDVFDREPYQPADAAHDLRALSNVILLPHVGSHTADANRRMAERALRNIARAAAGDFDALDLLNPAVREVLEGSD